MSNSKLNASIEAIEYIKSKIDINSIIGVDSKAQYPALMLQQNY